MAADKAEEQKETAAVLWAHVERVLRLVQKWVNWRWGYRMSDPALVFKVLILLSSMNSEIGNLLAYINTSIVSLFPEMSCYAGACHT